MNTPLYRSLDGVPGRIRLLILQPSFFGKVEIKCSLVEADLDRIPEYAALSYVWGDPENPSFIELQGTRFEVRRNLYEALLALRPRGKPLVLYVDALCINQSDIQERNSQVAMMGRIFKGATEVFTWMGPGFQDSGRAIMMMRYWGKRMFPKKNPHRCLYTIPLAFDERAWLASQKIFGCDWWTRVWVYQEVVLAKKATLVCGNDRLDWDELRIALRNWWCTIARPQIAQYLSYEQRKLMIGKHNMAVEMCNQRWRRLSNPGDTARKLQLHSFVEATADLSSTDPRDKIYALLGLVDVEDIPVTIDYGASVEKVYSDYVKAHIHSTHRLEPLRKSGIARFKPEPHLDLPSWIPDFRGYPSNTNANDFPRPFKASADLKAVSEVSSDGRVLHASGFVFDTVKHASPWQERARDSFILKWRDLALLSGHDIYPDGSSIYQAFLWTVTAESVDEENIFAVIVGFFLMQGLNSRALQSTVPDVAERPDVKAALEPFGDHVRGFVSWSGRVPADLSSADERTFLEPFLGPESSNLYKNWPKVDIRKPRDGPHPYEMMYLLTEISATSRRSFFVTPEGWMGLGPRTMEPGDVICVLYGCSTPLVIRPQGEHFLIVGECYVHGIMYGEAIKDVKLGKHEERTFMFQ